MIAPKLGVQESISSPKGACLVDEHEGNYESSRLGKTILAEFFTLLEKTRKTLDSSSMEMRGEVFE